MIVLSDTEDRTIASSFIWTKHRNVTDGRTDRQICCGYYSGPRTRCKNVDKSICCTVRLHAAKEEINTIRWKSIPHIYNTNRKVWSSNTTVALSFIQFVRMASSPRCIINLEAVLHTHIYLTKYDAITQRSKYSRRNAKLHNYNLHSSCVGQLCLCLISVWQVITVWLTLLRVTVFLSLEKTHLLAVMRCGAVWGLACVWIYWNLLTETLCPVAFLQNCMLMMWLPVLSMICCVSNHIRLSFIF